MRSRVETLNDLFGLSMEPPEVPEERRPVRYEKVDKDGWIVTVPVYEEA